MLRICLFMICVLSTQGCGPPPPGPETKATLAAISALRQNQMAELMDLVTPETRAAFGQQLQMGSDADPVSVSERLVTDFGWQYQIPRRPWPKVIEGKDDPSNRVVQVYLGRELVRFPVRKIDGRWKVDLLNARTVSEGQSKE